MTYFINIAIMASLIFFMGRKQPDKIWFFTGALLKLSAGIILGFIFYDVYGEGDTIKYYEAAADLANRSFGEWARLMAQIEIGYFYNQPRAILFTKIVSGFVFFTGGDYWIVSLYLSVISFLAYWFFYRQIRTTLPNLKWPIIIGFLLLPSTLFWSAGILKGALTNASIVFLSGFCLKLFFRKKLHSHDVLIASLAVILLLYIKYYLLIVLIPLMFYSLFDIRAHRMGITKKFRASVYVGLFLLTIFMAPSVNPNLNISELPTVLYEVQQTYGTDQTIAVQIEPNWPSLLAQLPKSVWIGLYGPTIFNPGKSFGLVPRIENLFLVVFSFWSVILLIRQRLYSPDILVIATLIFILILCALLPLAAPNYGALVRYRAPVTPFLATLVAILPCWWIQKKLNR